MDCQKCGNEKTFEWASVVMMLGGFQARLCVSCCNAFHEYITALPLRAEFRELEQSADDIIIAAYGHVSPTEALAPIRARVHEINREFYAICKAWVAGTLEVGATVAAVDPEAPPTTTS